MIGARLVQVAGGLLVCAMALAPASASGANWRITSSPNPAGSRVSYLTGVSCVSVDGLYSGRQLRQTVRFTGAAGRALERTALGDQADTEPIGVAAELALEGVMPHFDDVHRGRGVPEHGWPAADVGGDMEWNELGDPADSQPDQGPAGQFAGRGVVCLADRVHSRRRSKRQHYHRHTQWRRRRQRGSDAGRELERRQLGDPTDTQPAVAFRRELAVRGLVLLTHGLHRRRRLGWRARRALEWRQLGDPGDPVRAGRSGRGVLPLNLRVYRRRLVPHPRQTAPFADRWNGTRWSVQGMPNPGGGIVSTQGVSCAALTACTVAGGISSGVLDSLTVGWGWNGRRWNLQSTPNPSGALSQGALLGAPCASATFCTAVGSRGTMTSSAHPRGDAGRESDVNVRRRRMRGPPASCWAGRVLRAGARRRRGMWRWRLTKGSLSE